MKAAKKSIWVAFLVWVCSMMVFLGACSMQISYKLYFRVDDEVYATIGTTGDEVIQIPADPEKEGYSFAGWYWDKEKWERPFTANSLLDAPISNNMSVYAKFVADEQEHTHVFDKEVAEEKYLVSAASCTGGAVYYKSCGCGEKGTEMFTVGSPVHDYEDTVVQPTCEAKGYTYHECKVCKTAYSDSYTDKLSHDIRYHEATAPDCETDGAAEYWACALCDKLFGDSEGKNEIKTVPVVSATGHTYAQEWMKDENYHWYAATCKHTDEVKDKAGHAWDEGKITKPATTTEKGEKTYTCTVCGQTKTEKIPVIVEEHTHSFTVKNTDAKYLVSAADCTHKAVYRYSCACGEKGAETFENGEALGHSFTNYVYNNDATCTEDGTKTAKCDRCDARDTVTAVGTATGHAWDEWVVDKEATATQQGEKHRMCATCGYVQYAVIEVVSHTHKYTPRTTMSTCTEQGYTTYICACGVSYIDNYVPALGHSFTNYVYNNDATCTENGTKTAKCDRCDATDTVVAVGTATGHTEVIDKAVAPTCTKTGLTEGRYCSVCKEMIISQTVIPALGHTFEEYPNQLYCRTCGLSNTNIMVEADEKVCQGTYYENGKMYVLYYIGDQNNAIISGRSTDGWTSKYSDTVATVSIRDLESCTNDETIKENVKTEVSSSLSAYISGSAGVKVSYGLASASLEMGFKATIGTTATDSYELASTTANKKIAEQINGIALDNGTKLYGNYKAVISATLNIYLIVECDLAIQATQYYTETIIAPGTTRLDLYYCKDVNEQPPVSEVSIPPVNSVLGVIGTGTANDPYKIGNESTLHLLRTYPSACFILTSDIDFQGRGWLPVQSFGGTFDGNGHKIFNYTINQLLKANDYEAGFIAKLDSGGLIKNLQIGADGYTTSIDVRRWHMRINAGAIAGYSNGTIINCKVVNFSLYAEVHAQDKSYKGWEFFCNAGGICGVQRGGTVQQCSVDKVSVYSFAWVMYNNLKGVARAGGIIGYAEATTIIDCSVTNAKKIEAHAEEWGENLNQADRAEAYAGGLVGHLINSDIKYCVVYNNSGVISSCAGNKNKTSAVGYFIGYTNNTRPYALICFDSMGKADCWASGTNSNYESESLLVLKTAKEYSYENLIQVVSGFNEREYWKKVFEIE